MNPLPFILLAISLPLLLGGCGVEEPVVEEPVVEEPVVEVKPVEAISETKPKTEGVNYDELEIRGNIFDEIAYHKGSPYTGKSIKYYENGKKESEYNYKDGKEDGLVVNWHDNGEKWQEINYKDGTQDGLYVSWHKNGQKKQERNFKDGEEVEGSRKYWNSKGEPVDTIEEAEAE